MLPASADLDGRELSQDAVDDLTHAVNLHRADANSAGGWTVPLRDIADPRPMDGRYSSLRDSLLITELAESRGLA